MSEDHSLRKKNESGWFDFQPLSANYKKTLGKIQGFHSTFQESIDPQRAISVFA